MGITQPEPVAEPEYTHADCQNQPTKTQPATRASTVNAPLCALQRFRFSPVQPRQHHHHGKRYRQQQQRKQTHLRQQRQGQHHRNGQGRKHGGDAKPSQNSPGGIAGRFGIAVATDALAHQAAHHRHRTKVQGNRHQRGAEREAEVSGQRLTTKQTDGNLLQVLSAGQHIRQQHHRQHQASQPGHVTGSGLNQLRVIAQGENQHGQRHDKHRPGHIAHVLPAQQDGRTRGGSPQIGHTRQARQNGRE